MFPKMTTNDKGVQRNAASLIEMHCNKSILWPHKNLQKHVESTQKKKE